MAVLQPLDQGIIHASKQGYRKHLEEQLLVKPHVGGELKIDLLSAIQMQSHAWKDVRDTICNCFRHAGLSLESGEAASLVQEDNNIGILWQELGSLNGALPEGVEL